MFKAITWSQYASVVFLGILVYYAFVVLRYYRVELLGLVKGKAAGKASVPGSTPATPHLAGKSSLIAKAALAVPAAPLKVAAPDEPAQTEEDEEDAVGEEATELAHQEEQPADEQLEPVADLPPFELPNVEVNNRKNYENDSELSFINDNSINFTEQSDSNSFLDTKSGMESADDDFSIGSTIGIAQLGDYLTSAVKGQITPAQLVEQEPDLANTDLLLAFFQTSTKSAQRATAHLYEGVAEPALN